MKAIKAISFAILGLMPISFAGTLTEFTLSFNGTTITNDSTDLFEQDPFVRYAYDWESHQEITEEQLIKNAAGYLCWDAKWPNTYIRVAPKESLSVHSISITYALFNKDGSLYTGDQVNTDLYIHTVDGALIGRVDDLTDNAGTVTIDLFNPITLSNIDQSIIDVDMHATGTHGNEDTAFVGIKSLTFHTQSAPEPSSVSLALFGLGALLVRRRRS